MTVKRLNEIAKRTNQIRIESRMHEVNSMYEIDSASLAEELLHFSDELLLVGTNYKYFWLKQSVLQDIHDVVDELLNK